MAWTYTGKNVQEYPVFKLPPVGDYDCQIIAAEEKLSQSGKDMIVLTVKLMHPEYKNEIKDFIVNNEHAEQRVYDILASCNAAPTAGFTVHPGAFIGKVGKVRIKHDPYNGEMYPKVQFWVKPSRQQMAANAPTQPTLVEAPKEDRIPF